MYKLIITPKTKIFELLETYPQLEEVLIAAAPPFKKLKNPVLRRTIAKVATLSQAATIGGLKVEELVNLLRKETGQDLWTQTGSDNPAYQMEQPDGFDPNQIVQTINISTMLDAGEQPVHEVLASINRLTGMQILEVIAPFIPAPLIDKALSLNVSYWIKKISETEYRVYFRKN